MANRNLTPGSIWRMEPDPLDPRPHAPKWVTMKAARLRSRMGIVDRIAPGVFKAYGRMGSDGVPKADLGEYQTWEAAGYAIIADHHAIRH